MRVAFSNIGILGEREYSCWYFVLYETKRSFSMLDVAFMSSFLKKIKDEITIASGKYYLLNS